MAKASQVNRNAMRAYKSKRDKSKRAALKAIVMDRTLPVEDRFNASLKLAQLPRNGSAVRVRLRTASRSARSPWETLEVTSEVADT